MLMRPSNAGRLERLVARVVVGREVMDVATGLGVAVSERGLSAISMGLTLTPAHVVVRADLPKYMKDRVLAHELGHVLVVRGQCPWVVPATEESFCDDFADALLAAVAVRALLPGATETPSGRLVAVAG